MSCLFLTISGHFEYKERLGATLSMIYDCFESTLCCPQTSEFIDFVMLISLKIQLGIDLFFFSDLQNHEFNRLKKKKKKENIR